MSIKNAFIFVALSSVMAGCAPSRPDVPVGQQGLVLDLTAANRGQCQLTGPNMVVESEVILRGDYFKAVGHIMTSTLRCTLADGQVVSTTSHRELYGNGFTYSALIVSRITGPREVEVVGYSEGPNGKVDVNGTLVFVPG